MYIMLKKYTLIVGAVFLGAAGLYAEGPLSLAEIRQLALANAPSLAQSALTARGLELDEKARVKTFMPTLSAGASAQMNLWGNPALDQSLSAGANAGVSQKLFDGGKGTVQKNINSLSASMAGKDAFAAYLAVLEAADSAYYDLLAASAALASSEASLESAEFALATATIRMQTGMMSYGDYLQILAEKEGKEGSRNQTRRALAIAGLKLASLTGQSAAPALQELDEEAAEELIRRFAALGASDEEALYGEVWKAAAKDNPALSRAGLSRQSAERSVALAARDYFPSLSASLSTGLSFSPATGSVTVRPGSFSLSLSIPLDYGVTANTVARRELDREKAGLNYHDAENSLALELRSAVLSCITQAESALSAQRSREYAERRYEYVRERFRLLQSSASDLSDAAALLANSRNQLTNARFAFLKGLSRLRSLAGMDDDEKLYALLAARAL